MSNLCKSADPSNRCPNVISPTFRLPGPFRISDPFNHFGMQPARNNIPIINAKDSIEAGIQHWRIRSLLHKTYLSVGMTLATGHATGQPSSLAS